MASEKKQRWIGFDLGGTKMMAQVLDGNFKTLGRKKKKTRAQEGREAGLERIRNTIESALDDAGIQAQQLSGIGVGCPGPLQLDRGVIIEAPNLGWRDVALKDYLEDAFECPAVILNDVDAGVYGEYRFGAGRGARCVVGVFPGTGIGGGCVYDGGILRGRVGSCLEIGHMQVLPNGPRCGCGLYGCLEAVASRLSISAAAAAAAYRGEAPYLLEHVGMDLAEIRSSALKASVEGGDRAVERIVRDAARWVGTAVGNVINLLAPDVVVLGGGLVEALSTLYLEEVRAGAEAQVMASFRGQYEIRTAELRDDAAVKGAAAWAAKTAEKGEASV